jgi:hypothetical protein
VRIVDNAINTIVNITNEASINSGLPFELALPRAP